MDFDLTTLIILALATISIRQLLIADRLTQWPRHKIVKVLDKAGGFLPYHMLYWYGCVACMPIAIAAGLIALLENNVYFAEPIIMAFTIRYLAQLVAIYFGDDENRDYPEGVFFPPDTPAQRRAEAAAQVVPSATP